MFFNVCVKIPASKGKKLKLIQLSGKNSRGKNYKFFVWKFDRLSRTRGEISHMETSLIDLLPTIQPVIPFFFYISNMAFSKIYF